MYCLIQNGKLLFIYIPVTLKRCPLRNNNNIKSLELTLSRNMRDLMRKTIDSPEKSQACINWETYHITGRGLDIVTTPVFPVSACRFTWFHSLSGKFLLCCSFYFIVAVSWQRNLSWGCMLTKDNDEWRRGPSFFMLMLTWQWFLKCRTDPREKSWRTSPATPALWVGIRQEGVCHPRQSVW